MVSAVLVHLRYGNVLALNKEVQMHTFKEPSSKSERTILLILDAADTAEYRRPNVCIDAVVVEEAETVAFLRIDPIRLN